MSKTVQILAGDNQYIQAEHVRPVEDSLESKDRLLIIMVHGFPGNKTAHDNVFGDLIHLISDKEYHSLRFDFRGCGESDGREEDFSLKGAADDLKNICGWAKDQGYERFIFIGEGLGAALSLLEIPKQALCYVFLWPMLELPRIAKFAFKADDIPDEWQKEGYGTIDDHRIGLSFIEELKETDILPILRGFEKPLMIMHGVKDQVSPVQQLEIVRAHVKARRVEITTFHDGTHGLPQVNHRKTMFYHIMQFIEKYT